MPTVFRRQALSWEKELVKAAVKRGGLGIKCPTETAIDSYQMLMEGTTHGTEVVKEEHNDQLRNVRLEMKA